MADAATLRITCPSCTRAGNAPARLAGKTVRCSQCGMKRIGHLPFCFFGPT